MGERAKGDGKTVRGYSKKYQTVDGIPLVWASLRKFSIKFLGNIYEFEKYRNFLIKDDFHVWTPEQTKAIALIRENLAVLYRAMVGIRFSIKTTYEMSPGGRAEIDKRCAADPVYFINYFVVTHDPRLMRFNVPTKVPLILYPSQEEAIMQIKECMDMGIKALVVKSRGEGASWIFLAYTVWLWLYKNDAKVGWGSRIRDYVDTKGDMKSLFEKIRFIIKHLPSKMKKKFNSKWDNYMRIINPNNGSAITGDGGDQIARGDRTGIYFVDEFSSVAKQQSTLAALSDVAPCTVLISTPQGRDKFFDEMKLRRVIRMPWWRNPAKNHNYIIDTKPEKSIWYENETLDKDPIVVKQEIDMDFDAYAKEVFIKPEWVAAAINLGNKYEQVKKGETVSGFDIAAGGADANVYISRNGNSANTPKEIKNVSTPLQAARKVLINATKDGSTQINFDEIGYGSDIEAEMSGIDHNIKWVGIVGNAKPSDNFLPGEVERASDKFRNLRAECWWRVRELFLKTYEHVNNIRMHPIENLISIKEHSELIQELSHPRMLVDGAKIGVESKKAMRSRGIKSPNFADALVYCFAKDSKQNRVTGAFNYANNLFPRMPIDPQVPALFVGSIICPDGIHVYAMLAAYYYATKTVKIHYCRKERLSELESVYPEINEIVRVRGVSKWFADDSIIKTAMDGNKSIWYKVRKLGFKTNPIYLKSMVMVYKTIETLFSKKKMFIQDDLFDFSSNLRKWRLKTGSNDQELPWINCFLVLIAGLMQNKYTKHLFL
jgi:hypothetical protein